MSATVLPAPLPAAFPALLPAADAPAAPERATGVSCRPLGPADAAAAVDLLTRGFPSRSTDYWRRAIDRLAEHARGIGMCSFGLVLESRGRLVGILLLIYSRDAAGGEAANGEAPRRCNMSSWYVEPTFQGYAPLLVARAARDRDVTFFNISPAVHVRPIIEVQGFRRYGSGRFWCLPMLGPWRAGVRVRTLDPLTPGWAEAGGVADPRERSLLASHAAYGCLCLVASTPEGDLPFAVLPRRTKGVVPTAQLVYCRSLPEFVRLAGPIGRHLAARGLPVVSVDADGAIPGLVGRFAADGCPKYAKGPAAPRVGDMSYTELVLFGP